MDTKHDEREWLEFLRKGIEGVQLRTDSSPDTHPNKKKKKKKTQNEAQTAQPQKPLFEPRENPPPRLSLPDKAWRAVLECPCTFPPEIFHVVMLNLIKNPNITSSHLFRADIFFDSEKNSSDSPHVQGGWAEHLKAEYQPRPAADDWPNFELHRTIVRQLVPRNPQLDRSLVQTCHFFQRQRINDDEEEGGGGVEEIQSLVVYIPHAEDASEIPFYHPTLSQLAFLHTSSPSSSFVTILYKPFNSLPQPLSNKLNRTALHLLTTIHKHGQGALLGYTKRVHLDTIIPQKTYQDTYTRLKTTYAKHLSQAWVEVTDPGKHVFEDLGIAAYLIELWRTLFGDDRDSKFPGFVDIGCGNGVLVYVLTMEGYEGWGFDARARKTWGIFPEKVQERLKQRLLVPEIFQWRTTERHEQWHDGMFQRGTFIVSNHADELTPWTPLLAYLNDSAFIAIPCCSHDLAGARFRAPATTKKAGTKANAAAEIRLPQQENLTKVNVNGRHAAAETGSLKRTEAQKKMPSAYSTLCSYVASLAVEVGFEPETDVLRIPSTRNSCIVGRRRKKEQQHGPGVDKTQRVVELIEGELRKDTSSIGADWVERVEKLNKKPSSGH